MKRLNPTPRWHSAWVSVLAAVVVAIGSLAIAGMTVFMSIEHGTAEYTSTIESFLLLTGFVIGGLLRLLKPSRLADVLKAVAAVLKKRK